MLNRVYFIIKAHTVKKNTNKIIIILHKSRMFWEGSILVLGGKFPHRGTNCQRCWPCGSCPWTVHAEQHLHQSECSRLSQSCQEERKGLTYFHLVKLRWNQDLFITAPQPTWPLWSYASGHRWRSFETWSPPPRCPAGSCMEMSSVTSALSAALRSLLLLSIVTTGAPENKVSVVKAQADEVLTSASLSHLL